MFGNGFSRHAIVNAHLLAARLDQKPDPELSRAARDLDDCGHWYRHHKHDGAMTYMVQALDALEFEDVACFFLLLAKRAGFAADHFWEGDYVHAALEEGSDKCIQARGPFILARHYARANDPAGVTIHVENSDDDPTRVEFHIGSDPIANVWAEKHGSLDGGTWETSDGEDFVYDSTYWHAGLFEELRKEGFRFDFSSYGEPDERDLAIAKHAAECDVCQGDWHRAEEDFDDEAKMAAHAVHTAEAEGGR